MKRTVVETLKRMDPRRLAIGWTVLIILLLTVPGRDIPEVDLIAVDKPVHAGLFFIFTILWSRVFRLGAVRSVVLAACLAVSFAVLSELYQGILPFDRTPDRFDVLANWTGTLLGSIVLLWHRKRSTRL